MKAEAIRLAESGLTKKQVGKSLGIGSRYITEWTRGIGGVANSYPPETMQSAISLLNNGESASKVARTLNVKYPVIIKWRDEHILNRGPVTYTNKKYDESIKQAALKRMEQGKNRSALGRELKISPGTLKKWFEEAIKEGVIARPPVLLKTDPDFGWVTQQYPQYSEWKTLAQEWMKGEHSGLGNKFYSLSVFFDKYLAAFNLPSNPGELLRRGTTLPDFATIISHLSQGSAINNVINLFLEWVVLRDFSIRADDGTPVVSSEFRNPVQSIVTTKPQLFESVRSPLPYGYIAELRKMLVQGQNFSDWKWAQQSVGVKMAAHNRFSTDWFHVDEDLIDKNDPDCVWRIREFVDTKFKPTYELWSPVRYVALLLKLQLPLRLFQVRMMDSGESDAWRYVQGDWIKNTNPLSKNNSRNHCDQGVFRRLNNVKEGDPTTTLYINTNKTKDTINSGKEKGYEVPWPVMGEIDEQPHYWLEKLRNWQEKYNPLKRRTSWTEVPSKILGSVKSDVQLSSHPDTCFLFRTAELKKHGEETIPVADAVVVACWYKLLLKFQEHLAANKITHADKSPIKLVFGTARAYSSPFPLHSLRVSLITALAIDGGLPIQLLVKLVGHSRLVMTLYYTKPGAKHMQDALIGANERLDAEKEKTIVSFLANAERATLVEKVIANSPDAFAIMVPDHPSNRNPAGWMPMHHGLCLVGGNTSEVDGISKVGGCYNGGTNIAGHGARIFGPIPGGPRNCVRCRWFVTEPHYVPALAAHLGNICYHLDEARNVSIKQDAVLQDLKKQKVEAEKSQIPFMKAADMHAAERLWESAITKFSGLAEDMASCWDLIKRCNAVADNSTGDSTSLVTVGSSMDVNAAFEEVESELLQLSGVCQNVEIYPDLEPGKAIFRRSQLLDAALNNESIQPVFMYLSEEEQLKYGNLFMRRLVNQSDNANPLIGMRKVCGLIDAGKNLSDFIGVDLRELLPEKLQEVQNSFSINLRNRGVS